MLIELLRLRNGDLEIGMADLSEEFTRRLCPKSKSFYFDLAVT